MSALLIMPSELATLPPQVLQATVQTREPDAPLPAGWEEVSRTHIGGTWWVSVRRVGP